MAQSFLLPKHSLGHKGITKCNLGTRGKKFPSYGEGAPRGDGGGVARVVLMSELGGARGVLYGLARLLGWFQIIIDLLTGHARKGCKLLANKVLGRKIGSKIYYK